MKKRPFLLSAAALLALASTSYAQSGTWTNLATGGNWNTGGNWSGGVIADGTGSTANFNTLNITVDNTVHLDGPHTLTNLIFGDTTSSNGWILDNNAVSTNILTLAGTTPTITVNALAAGKFATISAGIDGTEGLTKAGAGTLVLSNTANTFSGPLIVNTGELRASVGTAASGTYTTLGNADVTVNSGTTLRFFAGSTANQYTYANTINLNSATLAYEDGNHILAGGIALTGANTITGVFANKTLTLLGVVSGAGSLTHAGASTLNLANANNYGGSTNLTSTAATGILNLAFDNAAAPVTNILPSSGTVNMVSGATNVTLSMTGKASTSNVQTINGLNVSGIATNILNVTSGASGSATLNLGALNVTSSRLFIALPASGSVTTTNPDGLLNGVHINASGSNRFATVASGVITRATETAAATNADLTDTTGTANYILAASTGTTGSNLSANTIAHTGAAGSTNPNGSFTVNGLMQSGTGTWTIGSAAGTGTVTIGSTNNLQLVGANNPLLVNANIVNNGSNPSSVYKSGGQLVTLAGTNTYSGGTTIAQGTLAATTGAALGSGPIYANSFYGSAYASGGAPFLSITGAGTQTVTNDIVLPAPASASFYAIQKATVGTSLILSGTISGGNANSVFQLDTPNGGDSTTSFTLSGTNTFGGILRLNRGTVTLTNASAAGTADILIQTNANAAGNLIFSNSFTLPNNITITTANDAVSTGVNDVTLSGIFTTGVAWPKAGAGKLTLTNANNAITGATTVSAGTLSIGGAGRLNTTAAYAGNIVLTAATSTFDYASSAAHTLSGVISGAGRLTKSGTSRLTLSGTNTFTGGMTIDAGTIAITGGAQLGTGDILANSSYGAAYASGGTPFIAVTGAGAQTITNNIAVANPGTTRYYAIQKTGGSLVLSGVISGGGPNSILQLDSPTAGDSTTNITLSGTNTIAGQIRLNRGTVTLTNASAAGTASIFLQSNANAAGNLLFSNSFTLPNNIIFGTTNNNAISTAGNNVVLTGVVSGPADWTKTGAGTLTLANANNTFAGTMTVGAGTVLVSGAISGSTIVNAATLGGTGTLATTTVNAAGTLAPGASSIGDLTFTSLLMLAGTSQFETSKTGLLLDSDFVDVASILTLGGTLNVTHSGDALVFGDSFDLFDAPVFMGDFTAVNLPSLETGLEWNTDTLETDGIISVVPEPNTALALLGGLGVLLGLRRRRSA